MTFSPYAPEQLTPTAFFKCVNTKYPALLNRDDTALAYMKQMNNLFSHILSNVFYTEFNDYPVNRWFASFFNNPDCRILIRNINNHKKHLNIQLILIPGRKRNYKPAHEQYEDFITQIGNYFDNNIQIHTTTKLLTFIVGSRKRKTYKK